MIKTSKDLKVMTEAGLHLLGLYILKVLGLISCKLKFLHLSLSGSGGGYNWYCTFHPNAFSTNSIHCHLSWSHRIFHVIKART